MDRCGSFLSCLHQSSKLYNSKMQDFDVSWTLHIFGLHWCYASSRWVYGCSVVGSNCRGVCGWLVAYPGCATYPIISRFFVIWKYCTKPAVETSSRTAMIKHCCTGWSRVHGNQDQHHVHWSAQQICTILNNHQILCNGVKFWKNLGYKYCYVVYLEKDFNSRFGFLKRKSSWTYCIWEMQNLQVTTKFLDTLFYFWGEIIFFVL